MSSYSGPGIYQIIPLVDTDRAFSLYGGGTTAGAKIVTWTKTTDQDNVRVEIVAAGGTNGQAEVGDREYHILDANSGLFYCSKGDKKCITGESGIAPKNKSIRWRLIPSGKGTFFIAAADGTGELSVYNGNKANGTEIWTWPHVVQDNTQFLIKPFGAA